MNGKDRLVLKVHTLRAVRMKVPENNPLLGDQSKNPAKKQPVDRGYRRMGEDSVATLDSHVL